MKGGDFVSKLRYNRTFKNGLTAIIFGILLFSFLIGFFIVSEIQYNSLVSGMKSIEATIVDIDLDIHVRGPDEQEIYIEYEIDGITYSRELKTDTKISFSAGTAGNYSVGDKIQIFYDPQNPEIIASPRSVGVGRFYALVAVIGLALVLYALVVIIKNHKKFLVTQEEYDKEKEELKKVKREKKHSRARKLLSIFAWSLVGVFIVFVIIGIVLNASGH